MTYADFLESLCYVSALNAEAHVKYWDEDVPGLFYEPDLYIDSPIKMLVLINGSDSFYANQKKIWRNVEEPFEAIANFGKDCYLVNISLITSRVNGSLLEICKQFFDYSYVKSSINGISTSTIATAIDTARALFGSSKKASIEQVRDYIAALPDNAVIKQLVNDVTLFFSKIILTPQKTSIIPSQEIDRVQARKEHPALIRLGSSSRFRKAVGLCMMLPSKFMEILKSNYKNGVDVIEIPKRIISPADRKIMFNANRVLRIHGICESITEGISCYRYQGWNSELQYILNCPDIAELYQLGNALLSMHPDLTEYVLGCSNYEYVESLVSETNAIFASCSSLEAFADCLVDCSMQSNYRGINSERNWFLEVLLVASGISQTSLSQHASISGVTQIVTGSTRLSKEKALRIANVLYTSVKDGIKQDSIELVMRQRKYNFDTNAYGNPAYLKLERDLQKLTHKGFLLTGYPTVSSVEVPSWHREINGRLLPAGEIKTQFLLQKDDTIIVVKASSAHSGNSGHKRKEFSAKARVLSYLKVNGHLEINSKIFLVLVIDGEWIGVTDRGHSATEMLSEAGWDVIVDIDNWESAFNSINLFIEQDESTVD